MADIVSPAVRSRMMSGIRSKDTKPELVLRKGLHARGYRYRLHHANLPGKPDLVFAGRKAVIFAHGCFWHGHDCPLFKWPSTKKDFWKEKLLANRLRDEKALSKLTELGWRVAVVWECALKGPRRKPLDELLASCDDWLRSGTARLEIKGEM